MTDWAATTTTTTTTSSNRNQIADACDAHKNDANLIYESDVGSWRLRFACDVRDDDNSDVCGIEFHLTHAFIFVFFLSPVGYEISS